MSKKTRKIKDIIAAPKVRYAILIFAIASVISLFVSITLANRQDYVVAFNTNGGGTIEAFYVQRNQLIERPMDPIKEGYTFLGWYYKGEPYDFSNPVKDNIVLEAMWQEIGKVTSVSLNHNILELNVGQTYKLIATIQPGNATNKNVTWKSSDTSIVTVDANGNIKAIKAGTASVTVTTKDGNHRAKATIKVIENENITVPEQENIKVTGVILNKTTLSITVGASAKLTATVQPGNATNKNVTWKSSDTSIVTVDANGNIKAIKAGTTSVTVTTKDGNYSKTATITVIEKPASYTITFTPIVQEVTNAVMQYTMKITKNSNAFSNYQFAIYNNTKIVNNSYLSATKYNKNITTAMIKLNDGTEVTANVVYK